MQIRTIFNRRREKQSGAVEVEVYINRSHRKYIATGVRVEPRQWDAKNKRVVKHLTMEAENLKISNLLLKVNEYYRDCLLFNRTPGIEDMLISLGHNAKSVTLNAYFWRQVEADKPGIAASTYQKRKQAVARFDAFGTFLPGQFNGDTLRLFDNTLRATMTVNSTQGYHKIISMYMKRAMLMGIVNKNPYNWFKIPRPKASVIYLTSVEINKLRQYTGIERLEKVRDLFLFQCLTGMAYADMQALRPDDITSNFIMKPRQKTDAVPQMIPLLEEAQQILARFAGFAMCFPRISNQKMNAYLREIATIKGITKHLTTHVGRHTFATLMLDRGLPLETISHILGHTSTRTTQIYARLLQSKITNDLKRLQITKL